MKKTNKLFEGTERKALRNMLKWHRKQIKNIPNNSRGYYVLLGVIGQLKYLLKARMWV